MAYRLAPTGLVPQGAFQGVGGDFAEKARFLAGRPQCLSRSEQVLLRLCRTFETVLRCVSVLLPFAHRGSDVMSSMRDF